MNLLCCLHATCLFSINADVHFSVFFFLLAFSPSRRSRRIKIKINVERNGENFLRSRRCLKGWNQAISSIFTGKKRWKCVNSVNSEGVWGGKLLGHVADERWSQLQGTPTRHESFGQTFLLFSLRSFVSDLVECSSCRRSSLLLGQLFPCSPISLPAFRDLFVRDKESKSEGTHLIPFDELFSVLKCLGDFDCPSAYSDGGSGRRVTWTLLVWFRRVVGQRGWQSSRCRGCQSWCCHFCVLCRGFSLICRVPIWTFPFLLLKLLQHLSSSVLFTWWMKSFTSAGLDFTLA